MLFLQENMVHLVNQMSMPVIEVSLVLSKYLNRMVDELEKKAALSDEILPENVLSQWPIEAMENLDTRGGMSLERILELVDQDRMDILDTLIRTVINATELPFMDAVLALRRWEQLARSQLASASGVGQLFSPMDLPEEF
jgi:hypothetical protein